MLFVLNVDGMLLVLLASLYYYYSVWRITLTLVIMPMFVNYGLCNFDNSKTGKFFKQKKEKTATIHFFEKCMIMQG